MQSPQSVNNKSLKIKTLSKFKQFLEDALRDENYKSYKKLK